MNKYTSLDDFKNEQKISDSNGNNISIIFQSLFYEYNNNIYNYGADYDEQSQSDNIERYLKQLLKECKDVNPTLIPYEDITNIIFSDYTSEYDGMAIESSFIEKLKSDFENLIIKEFHTTYDSEEIDIKPKNSNDLYSQRSHTTNKELEIDQDDKNAILVIYKIIQHAKLAISQKESLYEKLKYDVDNLTRNVINASDKYENMMANFISILGIFAAIMMGAFGAIQGFSAIYSNQNDYSFTKIILISSFGLFSLISVLYILLSSISKLVGKELTSSYYTENIFMKYPIYSHSLLIISTISLATLAHLFKVNPPAYFPSHLVDNIWRYTILISFLIVISYYLHRLISQSSGYHYVNRHFNTFIMRIKYKLGLEKLLNSIVLFIVAIPTIFIIILLYNILK